MERNSCAIIPARGGSKGIPRKNIKLLCGKPLIVWTIEAALAAQSVKRVVVSTDDGEIADVSRRSGSEVVIRPPEISGDLASSESALLHVLETLQELENYQPEAVAFLQCTSPLTVPDDIDGTLHLVLDGGFDSAVTMASFHYFIWRENVHGCMEGVNHTVTHRLLRQQREPQYLEVGAVYAMRTAGFLEHKTRFFGRIGKYVIPASRAFEIDEPDDWKLAEILMRITGRVDRASDLSQRLAKVQAVVTDFDGVLTDNRVHIDQDGRESVVCSRADGWGISRLQEAGVVVACISTEENPVVQARCTKLKIPCKHGQRDKLSVLKDFLNEHSIPAEQCMYIGNDTNDRACLEYAGIAVVPRDAAPQVTLLADWQTQAAGGKGVLREVAARMLAATEEVL